MKNRYKRGDYEKCFLIRSKNHWSLLNRKTKEVFIEVFFPDKCAFKEVYLYMSCMATLYDLLVSHGLTGNDFYKTFVECASIVKFPCPVDIIYAGDLKGSE